MKSVKSPAKAAEIIPQILLILGCLITFSQMAVGQSAADINKARVICI